ncbi:MAG: hypothetical protein IIY52_06830 [Solobacterium sp.]|nr:hypothetical protein [Solobacterium sp.]MBQ1382510.1 hypothetical protein [Solobacterium sp.]MBQ1447540.1 hypothetical protein [Solobacterium sp.]MBQ2688589.1 hypothetical protein [Solobacterium sp.]MBQ6592162.1 hypothetical protein [Solobacterium sp.]
MKIRELVEKTGWKPLVLGDPEAEVKGGFAGDLLSWVMGNGKPGEAWVTVQVHLNVIAVSGLCEFSCIVLCKGAVMPEDVTARAGEEGMNILCSDLPAYETVKRLVELGI